VEFITSDKFPGANGADLPQVNFNISDNSISDLKQGKTDRKIGQEPTAETEGLQDYVVAYDAFVSSSMRIRSMVGSSQEQKNTGLQNLTWII